MNGWQWAGLIVFLVLLAFSLWLVGVSLWDQFAYKKKIAAVGAKPVVSALQDYHDFKAKLRREARADWSNEYRRMVSLGATQKEFFADCDKAHVSLTEGNAWQVTPPDFDTRMRVDTFEDGVILYNTTGYEFPPNPSDYGV